MPNKITTIFYLYLTIQSSLAHKSISDISLTSEPHINITSQLIERDVPNLIKTVQ